MLYHVIIYKGGNTVLGINKVLKKEGIEIVSKLDTLTVNKLATNIASVLASSFPELELDYKVLFIHISRLNMYFAKLPSGISAKYFYKNRSIYFDCNLDFDNLTDVAIHVCIHYLQEKRDKRGNIIKLGLCDYTDGSLPGIGFNEAAVQLMAAKASNMPYENVKYFDIELSTNTPMYYPLECALVRQMAYLVGESVLFDSTLHANNNFRNMFISLTSERDFFAIQKNIDLLSETQAKLESLYNSLENIGIDEEFVQKISKEIENSKAKVKDLFVNTQRLILTSYFDNAINLVFSPKAIENYRNKLYLFKNYIGFVKYDNFYNEYYVSKMEELEAHYDYAPSTSLELAVIKTGFFARIFHKIKLLFKINSYEKINVK